MKNKNEKNYTIIVGCGRLGSTIATALSNEGKNVLIIDKNEDSFRKLSHAYSGQTLEGDATNFEVLQEAMVDKATFVIPVTHSDSTNIMIAQIAKEIFKVNNVIARLYDPERDIVYKELGIQTIYPAYLEAKNLLSCFFKEEEAAKDE